jgi:hypothetical protein
MNYLCLISVLTLFSVEVFAQIPIPGSDGKAALSWEIEFDAALQRAEKEKKPILLDISTDWSEGSKKMEKENFASPGIQRQLKKFVLIRINPEASEKNRAIAKKYEATDSNNFPYLLILNYRGEEVSRELGFQYSTSFVQFLKDSSAAFKDSSLGYKGSQLPVDDSLMKAIAQMPKPDSLPANTCSIMLLDQCTVNINSNAVANMITRSSYYIVDSDRDPKPDVSIHYNSYREKVKLKSVRILDLKGVGRDLDVSKPSDRNVYSSENIYWDTKEISIAVPDLKTGQILDIVEEREIKPVMPGHYFFRWTTTGPFIVQSDLTMTFPENLGLSKYEVRCKEPIIETKANGEITWRLTTHNPHQPDEELFIPSYDESWQGYEFSTPSKWDDIALWFNGLCEGKADLPPNAKAKIAELKQTNSDPAALLQSIFDWITRDVRYVSVSLGESSHQPHPVSDTLTHRYGDCKDQALLMKSLCREAGFPASLVLLHSGFGHQWAADRASPYHFNHCIMEAKVGDKKYYLDPSAGAAKIDRLPIPDCSAMALRIDEKKAEVVTLPAYIPTENDQVKKRLFRLNQNGSATITEIEEFHGLTAHSYKEYLRRMTTVEKMRKHCENSFKATGRKLIDFSMSDLDDRSDSFQSKISYTVPRFGSPSAEGLMFKLLDESDGNQEWISRLDAPRVRPFRFYPNDMEVLYFEIELPEGANFKARPEDLMLETSFLRASRKITIDKNKLNLVEKSISLDATLPSSEAPKVSAAFRKLSEHRNFAFSITMPSDSTRQTAP